MAIRAQKSSRLASKLVHCTTKYLMKSCHRPLALFPCHPMAKKTEEDEFAVLRGEQTNGLNYDLDTAEIIAHLKQWQELCSFRIVGAKYDTVDIEFDTLPKDMDGFVKDLYDFCPDLVDQ